MNFRCNQLILFACLFQALSTVEKETQVEDFRHQISQDPAEKHRKKIREISGWNTASTKSPKLHGTGHFQTALFDLEEKYRLVGNVN